jgi:hypothetical protein
VWSFSCRLRSGTSSVPRPLNRNFVLEAQLKECKQSGALIPVTPQAKRRTTRWKPGSPAGLSLWDDPLVGATEAANCTAQGLRKAHRMEGLVSLRARRGLLVWLCILAKPFGVQFSLVGGLIRFVPNFGDGLVFVRWLYIHNQALPIGRADKPPTR